MSIPVTGNVSVGQLRNALTAPTVNFGNVNLSGALTSNGQPFSSGTPSQFLNVGNNISFANSVTVGSLVTANVAAPPPVVTHPTVTMTANSVGGYTASASTTDANINTQPYYGFISNFWYSNPTYASSGVYTGAVSTVVSGNSVTGEWLQLTLPSSAQFVSASPGAGNIDATNGILSLTLAGSVDGTTWTLLATFPNPTYSTGTFLYYRFITTAMGSGASRFKGGRTAIGASAQVITLGTSPGPMVIKSTKLVTSGDIDATGDYLKSGAVLVPIGTVWSFAGSNAPTNWLICNGTTVSRTTYAALYAVVGTTYGAGDGSTTFNLPDLQGRVPIGAGAGSGLSSRSIGNKGGEEAHAIAVAELPAHGHDITDPGHGHYICSYKDGGSALGGNYREAPVPAYQGGFPNVGFTDMYTNSVTTNITIKPTGSGTASNVMQPFVVLNYIIRAV